jgi:hypothetical protein
MYGLKRFLVDIVRSQHLGHSLDKSGDVRAACLLVGLVFPEGNGGGLSARTAHEPMPVIEAWLRRYGRGIYLLEDGDALVHLLWPNLDRHYSREHTASPSEPVFPDRSTLTGMMPATNILRIPSKMILLNQVCVTTCSGVQCY